MAQDNEGNKVLFTMHETPETGMIPFGKYRGQPVEVLLADQSYLQWLLAQAWFSQRYSAIHTLVINQGSMPDETPEHNAMQLRFLDDGVCRQAGQAFQAVTPQHDVRFHDTVSSTFEHAGIDVLLTYACWCWEKVEKWCFYIYSADRYNLHSAVHYHRYQDNQDNRYPRYFWRSHPHYTLKLELKPSLGDDYPAVLRKMLTPHGASLLLFDRWTSQMPLAQVQQLFLKSGRVLLPYSTLSQYSTRPGAQPIGRPQETHKT